LLQPLIGCCIYGISKKEKVTCTGYKNLLSQTTENQYRNKTHPGRSHLLLLPDINKLVKYFNTTHCAKARATASTIQVHYLY